MKQIFQINNFFLNLKSLRGINIVEIINIVVINEMKKTLFNQGIL